MHKGKQTGFTLLEMVLVITIMGIISVVIGRVLLNSYQTFSIAQAISTTDWQGFLAIERMTNDIHTIRSAGSIGTISANQLSFTDTSGASVQYSLSGTTLLRNSQPLARGVQSLSFSYRDQNGLTTATPSLVRFITISLNVTDSNLTQTFSSMSATRGMS